MLAVWIYGWQCRSVGCFFPTFSDSDRNILQSIAKEVGEDIHGALKINPNNVGGPLTSSPTSR